MDAIKLITKEGLKAEICSCSRGVKSDIDAIVTSGADSVHLVIPASDLHLEYKLKKSRDEVLKITEDSVQYAKDHGLIVELSAEDATRADINFVKKLFTTGISCGADRISPCDTVGILTPERAYQFFSDMRKTFPSVPISTHCHNDFGMAVANSIASLRAGATQVHATINGLGERAGNASLEEIAVKLKEIFLRVKNLGDKGKKVMDADLLAMAEAVMGLQKSRPLQLEEVTVVTGDKVTPTASVRLRLNDKVVTGAGTGVGPVDAAINAVKTAISSVEPIHLEDYHVKSVTGGTDAMVEVVVRLRKGDRTASAMAVREDIVKASVEAVISGMNVLMADYNNRTGRKQGK